MDFAITGLGAVSPLGLSADELCDGLLAGQVGIRAAPWAAAKASLKDAVPLLPAASRALREKRSIGPAEMALALKRR